MVWSGVREVVGTHFVLLALLCEGVANAVAFVWRVCEQHLSANMEVQREGRVVRPITLNHWNNTSNTYTQHM